MSVIYRLTGRRAADGTRPVTWHPTKRDAMNAMIAESRVTGHFPRVDSVNVPTQREDLARWLNEYAPIIPAKP